MTSAQGRWERRVFHYSPATDQATAVGIVAASAIEEGVSAKVFRKLALA